MRITTYAQLTQYLQAFKHGDIKFLIVRSRGGLGKTTQARTVLPDALTFKGHATPLSIYMQCLKRPTSLVIFDDVDGLVENKTNVALLKQLCELQEDKPVHYSTTYRAYGEDVPPLFKSNNKVLLLCNDIKKIGANMGALLTRGFFLDFEPSNAEILAKLREFAEEKDVVDYLETVQDKVTLDFRLYEKCVEIKDSHKYTGLSWREWLKGEYEINDDEALAREIHNDKSFDRLQKYAIWQERTGKSSRTYHRLISKLKRERRL